MAVNCDRTLPVVVSSHRSTCNCIVMKILFGLEYTFTIGIQFERYPLTYSTRPTDLTSISYYLLVCNREKCKSQHDKQSQPSFR